MINTDFKRYRNSFWKKYAVFVGICMLLSVIFIIYVSVVTSDVNAKLPEKTLERHIAELKFDAVSGSLSEKISGFNAGSEKYENINIRVIRNSYIDKIKNSNITYKIKSDYENDLIKTYNLLIDDKIIGEVELKGENAKKELLFLNSVDWSVENFTPFLTETEYNLKFIVPDGISLKINGISPDNSEIIKGSEPITYQINGLAEMPKISYTNNNGEDIQYRINENTVTPLTYRLTLSLPESISVFIDGNAITGEYQSEGIWVYNINEDKQPSVILKDIAGNQTEYNDNESLDFTSITINLPEDFVGKINGVDFNTLTAFIEENPDEAILKELVGAELPCIRSYCIPLFICDNVSAVITSRNGISKEYNLNVNKPLNISGDFSVNDIPDDINAEIDVLRAAECWSRLMTNDLEGEKNGFATMADYLILHSDYYDNAREWALGDDIALVPAHELIGFNNESVSNFVRYNENCFSCDIYFEKNMSYYDGNKTDIFNKTLYFVKYDDTHYDGLDNPHWYIAVMRDIY